MRIWRPRSRRTRNGYYGGFGAKRQESYWTPGQGRKPPGSPARPDGRRVRIRRRFRKLSIPGDWTARLLLLAATAVLLLFVKLVFFR